MWPVWAKLYSFGGRRGLRERSGGLDFRRSHNVVALRRLPIAFRSRCIGDTSTPRQLCKRSSRPTSGSTLPLDVADFGPFKQALNDTSHSGSHMARAPVFDEYDFALMLTRAYEVAFAPGNMRAGFRRTGMWPIDPVALQRKPLPASANDNDTVVSRCWATSCKIRERLQLQSSECNR
jgi:hypothetical protein